MPSLLLLEDDNSLGDSLLTRLSKEDYTVHWAKSIRQAHQIIEQESIDIALIDIGLEDGDGFRFVREMKKKVPFLFLTAMSSAEHRLEGFELGAEDYIPKPFHFKELLLRLQQVRAKHKIGKEITCGTFTLDVEARQIQFTDGSNEQMTERDCILLKTLIERSPKAVKREEVLRDLWNEPSEKSSRIIDNSILRLRQLLEKTGEDRIQSIRGLGYQWDNR